MSTRAPRAIAGRPKKWGPAMATPPNAIVFGSGYVRLAQMARAGFWLNLAGALPAATMAYFFAGSLLDLRGKR
jgi:hypothetical protein